MRECCENCEYLIEQQTFLRTGICLKLFDSGEAYNAVVHTGDYCEYFEPKQKED